MDVGELRVDRIEFPEPASTYARTGRKDELVAELGDNYGKYHAFLAKLSRKLGPRPNPREYQRDPDGYFAACGLRQELLLAEQILRRCRAHRTTGRALGEADSEEPPLRDAQNRLVAVDSRAADPSDPGFADPDGWVPPRPILPGERP